MGTVPMTSPNMGNPWEHIDFGPGGMFNGFNQINSMIPGFPGTGGNSGINTDFLNLSPMNTTSSIPGAIPGSFSPTHIPGVPTSSGGGNVFGIPTIPGSGGGTIPQFNFGSQSSGLGIPGLPQISGHDLQKLYGKGIGGALASFLNSGAGFNQQTIQAQINAMMPFLSRGEADLMNQFGNSGLASSSTAALGMGDFESQFFNQIQTMIGNEYEQSVNRYISVLTGTQQDAKEQQAQGLSWQSLLGNFASGGLLGLFGGL